MPSLISPSLAPNTIFQNFQSKHKEKFNPLTSPAMISDYNRKTTYSISKIPQKSSKSHIVTNSPLFITNQNNISSISNNYHLPGSIMPLASLSPHTNFINEQKNNHNSFDNLTSDQRFNNNSYISENNPPSKESSYPYSSKKTNVLSQSKSNNEKIIPLVSPYVLPKNKDGNDNTSNVFSPLVGPMITGPIDFETSPTIKPISQSMLPITPSVLMHLDKKQASSVAQKINTDQTKTTKQASSSSNVDLIDINDMKRILDENSINFSLSDMNVNVNFDDVNELNSSLNDHGINSNNNDNNNNNNNNNNNITPIYMDYVMKDSHNDTELNINIKAQGDTNHHQNKNIENNPLLTPLILDSSAIEFDHQQTYSSLNNTLLLGSNQDDNDTSSNTVPTITPAELSKNTNGIKNLNTPISVSTIFNRYNSRHKSETDIIRPINTLNKNKIKINEAIDKLISSKKKFHESSNGNQNINQANDNTINVHKIVLNNANDLSKYLKANAIRLKSSHSSIPTSSIISPNDISLSSKALTPEIIANATHPISPNHIFTNHSISPNIFSSQPTPTTSTTSFISNSSNNSKKGKNIKSPNKKLKTKKKAITNQSGSKNENSTDDITPIATSNPNQLLFLNNSKTTPITIITSSPPTALSMHLSSIPKPDSNDTGTPFKSLPPPSLSSNINIIHGNVTNSNLPTLTTTQSNNSLTIASAPSSSIPSTPSSTTLSNPVASIVNVASKLKPVKPIKIKKPIANPRITPLLPNKITSMDDALKLASKSNYQNVLGGETTSLGLNPNLISGIEVRKTNHKNAEQKRRDSLKQGFENLKVVVPFISDKNPSKIMIITRSYEYICKLKENQKKHEKEMKAMKLKEKLYLEKLKSKGVDVDDFMKELEKEIANNMEEEEEEESPSILSSNTNIPPTTISNNSTSASTTSTNSSQPLHSNMMNKKEIKSSINKRKAVQEDTSNKNPIASKPDSKKLKVDISNESNVIGDKDDSTKK